jgi:hypothetical protein
MGDLGKLGKLGILGKLGKIAGNQPPVSYQKAGFSSCKMPVSQARKYQFLKLENGSGDLSEEESRQKESPLEGGL